MEVRRQLLAGRPGGGPPLRLKLGQAFGVRERGAEQAGVVFERVKAAAWPAIVEDERPVQACKSM